MARPARNNVDYFPFYCKEGRAMFYIEEKYGNDGYASWIKILRQLAVTNFHYLNLSDDIDAMYLAAKCKVDEETLNSIITDLSKLGEFNLKLWSENKIVYSEKFIESIEDAYNKRNNKLHTLISLREHLTGLGVLKPIKLRVKGGDNTQSIIEYNKEEEKREEERKQKEKKVGALFERFWDLYDKKTDREKCFKKFKTLRADEMEILFIHVPKYVESTPDKKFRKAPSTYLNNKSFNDEIIISNGQQGQSFTEKFFKGSTDVY